MERRGHHNWKGPRCCDHSDQFQPSSKNCLWPARPTLSSWVALGVRSSSLPVRALLKLAPATISWRKRNADASEVVHVRSPRWARHAEEQEAGLTPLKAALTEARMLKCNGCEARSLKVETRACVEEFKVIQRRRDMIKVFVDQTYIWSEVLKDYVEMHLGRIERLIKAQIPLVDV
jgi:hypothetical protein